MAITQLFNNNLLHANIEKLDKFNVDKDNIVEVEKLGTKRDIYFTCDGLYPPKSTPYAFDAGIDLVLQKQTVLKPGVYSKIDTGLKFRCSIPLIKWKERQEPQ